MQTTFFLLSKNKFGQWFANRNSNQSYRIDKGSIEKCEYLNSISHINREWISNDTEVFATTMVGIGYVKNIVPFDKTKPSFDVAIINEVLPLNMPTILEVDVKTMMATVKVQGIKYGIKKEHRHYEISNTFDMEERILQLPIGDSDLKVFLNTTDKSLEDWITICRSIHENTIIVSEWLYSTHIYTINENGALLRIRGLISYTRKEKEIKIEIIPTSVIPYKDGYVTFVFSKESIRAVTGYTTDIDIEYQMYLGTNNFDYTWLKQVNSTISQLVIKSEIRNVLGVDIEYRRTRNIETHRLLFNGNTFDVHRNLDIVDSYHPVSTPDAVKDALVKLIGKKVIKNTERFPFQ